MRSPATQAIEDTAMNDTLCRDLLLLRQRIEVLYDTRPDDEVFQDGLNFAVSGLEQALDAIGEDLADDTHPEDSLDSISSSLAELHIRIETRSEASPDDPIACKRLAWVDHLLAQACTLLATD
jgi:hypothetical protein